jgi:putative peptide zinc metalloprotease protein
MHDQLRDPTKPAVENPETKRPLFAEMRSDLEIAVVPRGDSSVAVVKDPVAHRFYEMSPADVQIARHLRTHSDAPEQLRLLRENCPAETHGLDDREVLRRAARISAELRATGLARSRSGTLFAEPSIKQSLLGGLRSLSRLLFIRIRLFDPTPILDATASLASPFFSRWFLWTILAVFGTAFSVFMAKGGLGQFNAAWFSSLPTLAAFYVGIALLKLIHESGHALAVRQFGGQTHEVGLTLVAGLPLFHVEASDSYMFPKKSHRTVVAAAGILIELLACALLVCLWLVLAEGFLRELVASLVVIASISTLLFNANPLMRFDGYYILTDALDMPDLRPRARDFTLNSIASILSGSSAPKASTRREAWILGTYGVASPLYLLVVFFGIWKFLSTALEPHGLKWVGDLLMFSWAATGIISPSIASLKKLVTAVKSTPSGNRKRNGLLAGGIAGAFAILLLVPLPRNIIHDGSLQPADTSSVRVAEEGRLAEILVAEGEPVLRGQTLAEIENLGIERDYLTAKFAWEQAQARLRAAMSQAKTSDVGVLQSELAAAESAMREASRRHDALTLVSSVDGIIASRRLDSLIGTRLPAGGAFCVIRPSILSEFLVTLDEKQSRLVAPGAAVQVRLHALPHKTYRATIPSAPLRLAPPKPGEIRPPGADSHFAVIQLENPDEALKIGMSGRARIHCGKQSLGGRFVEGLLDFLHLDIRMR